MAVTWDIKNRERPEKFTDLDEPWVALSCGIIKQAVDDYEKGYNRSRQEIERFIRSEYFRKISNIDPDYLINKLKETYPNPRIDIGMIRG